MRGTFTVYRGDVWSENGRDQKISPDEILAIHGEQLRFVGELVEERTDRRAPAQRRVGEECVLRR